MSLSELRSLGLAEMSEEELERFLTNQGVGVLGLPAPDGPYLLPMSFGYDGTRLYFSFVLGESSRKETLADRADSASVLVYRASSPFTWQSVVLRGTIERVPAEESERVAESMDNAWHPDLLAQADLSRGVGLYRFRIDERVGVRHTGLPPGFERTD